MRAIDKNLSKIEEWIAHVPDPWLFKSNDEYMSYAVELMNRAHYLLSLGVSLAPTEQSVAKGYTRNRAIVAGHMVRIVKLYEGLLSFVAGRKLELAAIFTRLVFETAFKMEYLMQAKKSTFRSFILTSYKSEKEILSDLDAKRKKRPLIPIEKRMMKKIKSRLRKDRISIESLMKTRNWNLDGKHFRRILEDLGLGHTYPYSFGSSSHPIHGDWYDISLYHLQRSGRYYMPKLAYDDPDPRLVCPITIFCLDRLLHYIEWSRGDPNNQVSPVISKLRQLTATLDAAHEQMLGTYGPHSNMPEPTFEGGG